MIPQLQFLFPKELLKEKHFSGQQTLKLKLFWSRKSLSGQLESTLERGLGEREVYLTIRIYWDLRNPGDSNKYPWLDILYARKGWKCWWFLVNLNYLDLIHFISWLALRSRGNIVGFFGWLFFCDTGRTNKPDLLTWLSFKDTAAFHRNVTRASVQRTVQY